MNNELNTLKEKAKKLYSGYNKRANEIWGHLDCGSTLAEHIHPDKTLYDIGVEFNKIWARIKQLDSNAPDTPFKQYPMPLFSDGTLSIETSDSKLSLEGK